MRRVVVLLAFVASFQVGCGGGNGWSDRGPADVSGQWSFVTTNAEVATFTDCIGDLTFLEEITVATAVADGPMCVTNDPFIVTQVDNSITFLSQSASCDDGSSYSQTGGGTMVGTRLDGSVRQVFSTGAIGDTEITGSVNSTNTLIVQEERISFQGTVNGSCNVQPRLEHHITISSPAFESGGLARIQQGAALAIYRALVATPVSDG